MDKIGVERQNPKSIMIVLWHGNQECSMEVEPHLRTRRRLEIFVGQALVALKRAVRHQKPGRKEAQERLRRNLLKDLWWEKT